MKVIMTKPDSISMLSPSSEAAAQSLQIVPGLPSDPGSSEGAPVRVQVRNSPSLSSGGGAGGRTPSMSPRSVHHRNNTIPKAEVVINSKLGVMIMRN